MTSPSKSDMATSQLNNGASVSKYLDILNVDDAFAPVVSSKDLDTDVPYKALSMDIAKTKFGRRVVLRIVDPKTQSHYSLFLGASYCSDVKKLNALKQLFNEEKILTITLKRITTSNSMSKPEYSFATQNQ